MQSEEQRLIDGLFSRLKEAESRSASRDSSAEERIAGHIKEQPFAPYYMAQTILIQEAAIKQLNERIQALESQVSQLQAAKPSSGGFLSGLFLQIVEFGQLVFRLFQVGRLIVQTHHILVETHVLRGE